MTATETVDLFSFDTRRHRVMEWQAPGPVAKAASGMSGLETMCAIRDGILHDGTGSRREPRKYHRTAPWRDRRSTSGYRHGCAIATMQPAGQTSVLGHAGPQA